MGTHSCPEDLAEFLSPPSSAPKWLTCFLCPVLSTLFSEVPNDSWWATEFSTGELLMNNNGIFCFPPKNEWLRAKCPENILSGEGWRNVWGKPWTSLWSSSTDPPGVSCFFCLGCDCVKGHSMDMSPVGGLGPTVVKKWVLFTVPKFVNVKKSDKFKNLELYSVENSN